MAATGAAAPGPLPLHPAELPLPGRVRLLAAGARALPQPDQMSHDRSAAPLRRSEQLPAAARGPPVRDRGAQHALLHGWLGADRDRPRPGAGAADESAATGARPAALGLLLPDRDQH